MICNARNLEPHTADAIARETAVPRYLIALGANIPTAISAPVETLDWAVEALRDRGIVVVALSRFYSTPAYPAGSGPDFANAATIVDMDLTPEPFLAILHEIEADAGRVRDKRWGARVLDLDLLAQDQTVLPDPTTQQSWMALTPQEAAQRVPGHLIVPHPRLHERGFVLAPLLDIAARWVHPITKQTVQQMYNALDPADLNGIVPIFRDKPS